MTIIARSPKTKVLLFLFFSFSFILISSFYLTPSASTSFLPLRSQFRPATQSIHTSLGTSTYHFQSPTPALPLNASLQHRLQSLLDSPIADPSDLVKWHSQTCPQKFLSKNMNKQQLELNHILWSSLNASAIQNIRLSIVQHLESQAFRIQDPTYHGVGRGFVFTAGNADTFTRVLLTLKILNDTIVDPSLTLPNSEIFSFPDEKPDPSVQSQLKSLGAKLRTLPMQKGKGRTKNYHMKASAILQSSFQTVLYLDSDNPPTDLKAVMDLWDSKAFNRLKVIFWPDYWKTQADNPIWSIIGTQCRDEWEQEAGQILIDKNVHYDALVLAEFMLQDYTFWFSFTDGDKDAFRYAFLALRKRWAVPGRYVAAGALPFNAMSGFCGHTMLQHDHMGRPLFVHQNLLKQIPSGVGKGAAWGRSRSLKTFSNNSSKLFSPPPSLPPSDNDSSTSSAPIKNQQDVEEVFVDYDVDADHLANADKDGNGISTSPHLAVRRRAAYERGIKSWFHGGWISALCIDMEWKDMELEEGEETKVTEEENPVEVRMWKDDERLHAFEDRFFRLGGSVNGAGF